jgi:hypothetical protein
MCSRQEITAVGCSIERIKGAAVTADLICILPRVNQQDKELEGVLAAPCCFDQWKHRTEEESRVVCGC